MEVGGQRGEMLAGGRLVVMDCLALAWMVGVWRKKVRVCWRVWIHRHLQQLFTDMVDLLVALLGVGHILHMLVFSLAPETVVVVFRTVGPAHLFS